MIIDAEKTVNELEELRQSNYADLCQLHKLLASTYQRLSKIDEFSDIDVFLPLLNLAENNKKVIEAALHGLKETDSILKEIIEKHLAFVKVKFD